MPFLSTKITLLSLYILTFFVIQNTFVACQDFKPERVHLVDSYQGNYLFRGNEPIIGGKTFAYAELNQAMIKILQDYQFEVPTTFQLIDLNFLNGFTNEEYGNIKVEENWFKDYSQSQNFFHWPIYGSVTNPEMYTEDVRTEKALTFDNWDGDRITPRLKITYDLLHKVETLPKFIYFHCEAGSDRTGEFAGCYKMLHFGWDYQQVIKYDTEIAGRKMVIFNSNHLQWYCYYLKENLNMNISCELEY
ncbi:phosphatase [Anaeramoeba flamelloides]|uniref:Phosphatase n=1 Tax=Anaeramoeba flamelloides TaxID=1746091 RepID=A0ABQ8ZCG7_9EUKA|nr:phosphatase [Anaeramoeba flamelloides]